jgi:hypothetical protein
LLAYFEGALSKLIRRGILSWAFAKRGNINDSKLVKVFLKCFYIQNLTLLNNF